MDISEEVGDLGFSFRAMNPHRLEEVQAFSLVNGMDLTKGRASESVFITFPQATHKGLWPLLPLVNSHG